MIGIIFLGLFLVIWNLEDIVATDTGIKICSETYDRPHSFLFNSDYRSCVLDGDHQRELVRKKIQTIENQQLESLSNLTQIQAEAMAKVNLIGPENFVFLQKELPPYILDSDSPDPFYTDEYPSRLLKIRFDECDFFRWRTSDDDPDPTEFSCKGYVGTDRREYLQGNKWYWHTPAKYVATDAGAIDLFVEVISIPSVLGVDLRYEVHGFEVSEAMVERHYETAIKTEREEYGELLK